MHLGKQRLGQVLQAVGNVGAQDDIHQIAQRVGHLDQIVRLGGVAILVQLLLDQAHAQGDHLVRQVDGRCVFNMRAENPMEFDERVQLRLQNRCSLLSTANNQPASPKMSPSSRSHMSSSARNGVSSKS